MHLLRDGSISKTHSRELTMLAKTDMEMEMEMQMQQEAITKKQATMKRIYIEN